MTNFGCRCRGRDRDGLGWDDDSLTCGQELEGVATQEDGLCDDCRCVHGCCEQHTSNEMHYTCLRERKAIV